MLSFERGGAGSVPEQEQRELFSAMEKNRIPVGVEFSDIYSDYSHDMERTSHLKELYAQSSPETQLGKKGEALIFSLLTKSSLSEHLQFRASHPYDDFFHGVDMLVEAKNQKNPAIATIDITINQEDIKGASRKGTEGAEARPVGLDKKLERIRGHIDYLSNFDPAYARDLSVWLNSGGLHESHVKENEHFFKDAEKVFLVKYYKTPEDSEEPLKPTYVIGGPQVVISIDTVFINKALQGDREAKEIIGALSLLEFGYGVHTIQEYLDEKARSKPSRNLFFDTYYTETKTWSKILSQPALEKIINELGRRYGHNPEFKQQLIYYSKVLGTIFKK